MPKRQKTFQFTLITDAENLTTRLANRLYAAGCDDASVSQVAGRVLCEFDRSSTSFLDAVLTAVRDVESTGIRVERVERDDELAKGYDEETAETVNALLQVRGHGHSRDDLLRMWDALQAV